MQRGSQGCFISMSAARFYELGFHSGNGSKRYQQHFHPYEEMYIIYSIFPQLNPLREANVRGKKRRLHDWSASARELMNI